MTNCCVVDLRFIGLPTAVVLPNPGRRVICVDVNAHVVSSVKEGCTHNVEPDLDLALAESIAFGSLTGPPHQPLPICSWWVTAPLNTSSQRGMRF